MKRKNGFTLVELLVVISILGILSTVALVVYSGVTARARDNQRIKNLQAIKQALELYRSDVHNYPTSLTFGVGSNLTNGSSTYLSPIPQDVGSPNRIYNYFAPTDGLSFILCAKKESSSAFDPPDGCSSLSCGAVNCDMGISSQ